MPRRRQIKAVLDNFLSTFTSRYTDFDGYWLFGFVVADLDRDQINLMADIPADPNSPGAVLARSAVDKFRDQLSRARIDQTSVASANLTITRSPEPITGHFNGLWRRGYQINFEAWVVTDLGRRYTANKQVFVAPHDPGVERRAWSPSE